MKYFDRSTYESEYYYFASVFDPRMKDRIFKHNPDLFDSQWAEGCYSTLIEFLEKSDPPSVRSDPISDPSSSAGHFLDDDDGILGHYGPSLLSHPADPESAKGELQCYLSIDPIHLQDHPLLWWKQNEAHFPRIAAGAKAYLAIPGSSVSVERAFSAGRDVISLRRAALEGDTIRHLMLYRSYLKLEKQLK